MSESGWQRARTDQQIEERVTQILEAAAELFRHEPFEDVTMQKIARKADFTRSNLYRYFTTREEIFLALYVSDIGQWANEVVAHIHGPMDPEEFLETWIDVLLRQERLIELTPLLAPTLERNSSEQVYRDTKIALAKEFMAVGNAVQVALPDLAFEGVADFIQMSQVFTAGAVPMAKCTEMQERVLEELNMPQMRIDYRRNLPRVLRTYLKGLRQVS